MRSFKVTAFGLIMVGMFALPGKAMADGSAASTKSDHDYGTIDFGFEDGKINKRPAKIELNVGGYSASGGASGTAIKLEAGKGMFLGQPSHYGSDNLGEHCARSHTQKFATGKDWQNFMETSTNSATAGYHHVIVYGKCPDGKERCDFSENIDLTVTVCDEVKSTYKATVSKGPAANFHASADLKLQGVSPSKPVNSYDVRVGGLEAFNWNRELETAYRGDQNSVTKTASITVLSAGYRASNNRLTTTQVNAAEITPVAFSVDRAWRTSKNRVPLHICLEHKPIVVLAGNIRAANAEAGSQDHVGLELADTSACLGVGVGENGGEIRASGKGHAFVVPSAGENNRQFISGGSIEYLSRQFASGQRVKAGVDVLKTIQSGSGAEPLTVTGALGVVY
jgi:hypothetical protein